MLSHSKGPDLALLDRTTDEQLEAVANRWPDRLAVASMHQGRRLAWRELRDRAARVAAGLASLGVKRVDRVGVWATNCWEWVVVHFACAKLGAVLVSVNPALRARELAFVLKKSRMKALFLRERDERSAYAEILAEARREAVCELEHVILFENPEWTELLETRPRSHAPSKLDDVINIQYTSGTTGSPKGVSLTHRNLVNNGFIIARALRYTELDRICLPVPLSHCFGNVIGTMAALARGAGLILPNWCFDARATLAAIEAEKATSLYGVPTMFIAELSHPEFSRFDVSSLRTGVMAGAPCPMELMRRVISDLHCPELAIGYGLTETSPIITMSDIDDELERRVCTVGKVMPCTEIKVVSVENGKTVETGAQGEVCARGYMLMKGYDDDPEATARAIDGDGWFHSGDLGTMRDDGYLQITGRAKDMIIRGGENIYPREVEEFLYAHPKIAEVHIAGLPDERLGEIVLAWIRLKTGECATADEIREFCRDRIAHFKIPQRIRFVDSFPTTPSGKIQKFRIREMELREQEFERDGATLAARPMVSRAPRRS
ncbi:MAG: AMP-binding protein [Acidobacteriaceae bacterium]|nr:AMP-binding protein [Acidobacteriaceae bacterium]MBV9781945.1 AMP-binding protein [Acidobacteriaceae bacterium]